MVKPQTFFLGVQPELLEQIRSIFPDQGGYIRPDYIFLPLSLYLTLSQNTLEWLLLPTPQFLVFLMISINSLPFFQHEDLIVPRLNIQGWFALIHEHFDSCTLNRTYSFHVKFFIIRLGILVHNIHLPECHFLWMEVKILLIVINAV